jgi:hypothetical protein
MPWLPRLAQEYLKVGEPLMPWPYICASLWGGSEVFLLNLANLWKYRNLGKDGVLPEDPLKIGVDLLQVPYMIVTLIGEW